MTENATYSFALNFPWIKYQSTVRAEKILLFSFHFLKNVLRQKPRLKNIPGPNCRFADFSKEKIIRMANKSFLRNQSTEITSIMVIAGQSPVFLKVMF